MSVDSGCKLETVQGNKANSQIVAPSAFGQELSGTSARRVGHGAESADPGGEPVGSAATSSAARAVTFGFFGCHGEDEALC